MSDRPAVKVGEGRLGRGVFAVRAAEAGETLELCPTLEVADGDVAGLLGNYVFRSGTNEDNVILMLGYGMLYNHSSKPNAEYVEDEEGWIAFVATRPVEAGDELTIDYGAEWWDTRGLTPD